MQRRHFLAFLLNVLTWVGLFGCTLRRPAKQPTSPPSGKQQETVVPPPRLKSDVSLEEVLARRRSVREYLDRALSLTEISQLFWAAQGITASWGGRTAPSAGALYPLEVYAATAEGCYHYLPKGHKIERVSDQDLRKALWEGGLYQDYIREAAAVFVIAAVYERTSVKYGDRAERYVLLEAGHAAQNLLLQAVALGLGAVPIGAFYDKQIQVALALPTDQAPLYLIPVGYPKS